MITVSDFYKKIFGQKVYKISLDAGCTCPTRDGSKGKGGCIFCSQSGSGDFVANKNLSITEQVENAKLLVNRKFSRASARGEETQKKYIAYFQNFTNTYGNPQNLLKKYQEALLCKNVLGLAIATRPDCLDDEILSGIAELSQKYFIQLELGFQTSNEKTAQYCRRAFPNSVYEDAVKKITEFSGGKIHIVTHLIFGLPGDSDDDMKNSVKYVCDVNQNKNWGIKITSLYILKNTDLEKDFLQKKFNALSEEKYLELLKTALSILPQNVVIHRLTGDPPKNLLIAPQWTANKREVLNRIQHLFFRNSPD